MKKDFTDWSILWFTFMLYIICKWLGKKLNILSISWCYKQCLRKVELYIDFSRKKFRQVPMSIYQNCNTWKHYVSVPYHDHVSLCMFVYLATHHAHFSVIMYMALCLTLHHYNSLVGAKCPLALQGPPLQQPQIYIWAGI